MPQRKQELASEAAWEQDHSDEILEHLPKSFQTLARFALKRGDGDASAKPTH